MRRRFAVAVSASHSREMACQAGGRGFETRRPPPAVTTWSRPSARVYPVRLAAMSVVALILAGCGTTSTRSGTPQATSSAAASQSPAAVATTATATIDCQHDGAGGGTRVVDSDPGGGCSYTINMAKWCGGISTAYEIESPPGTFLAVLSEEGDGYADFRWSDGALVRVQGACR